MPDGPDGGVVHFESRGGRIMFFGWLAFITLFACGVLAAAVSGSFIGALLPAVWISGIGLVGAWQMSTTLEISPEGEMTFRGLLRRRTMRVSELRRIGPGNGCLAFRFKEDGALLAWTGDDAALVAQLRARNPYFAVRRAPYPFGPDRRA